METTKKIKRVNKDEPTGFDRFNRVSKGANAVLNIIFIIMSLLCVIPILLVVAISFSAEDSITEYGYRFIPKIFSLEGYTFLASQSTMLLRALGVSLFVTIVGTVLGVMLTTLMGYVLSRPNYKLNGFLTMVVFIPMVFNGGLVSTYFVVSQLLGLKNTIWALILPLAVSSFNVISSGIPDRIREDGRRISADDFQQNRSSDFAAGTGNHRSVPLLRILERLVSVHAVH